MPTLKNHPTAKAGGKDRVLNVRSDAPDLRDRYYEPALIPLEPQLDNGDRELVLDQGQEGACTGFGLAAVINILRQRLDDDRKVSPRMLYEMAQKHDEWPGEDYSGSSCRGAIKGWKNMGVCSDELWPYSNNKPGQLTIERAKDARNTILGAYYRLSPNLNDYHAAINETGAIYVSASVHEGWNSPKKIPGDEIATISSGLAPTGGHAFAIVGYNKEGFIVQNSWGKRWGTGGFAIWRYQDWAENVSDGWVFRLAVSTPNVFSLTTTTADSNQAEFFGRSTKRIEIAGHFAHFDDGELETKGNYWSTHEDIEQTIQRVKEKAEDGSIKHFLIYAHGGLNSPKASANRIAAMKDGFLRNGIYPFHMMYDTGFGEELGDIISRAFSRSEGLFDRWKKKLADANDKILEGIAKKPGRAIWEEMKRGAAGPWQNPDSDGTRIVKSFIDALESTGIPIHIVGHSTGAILLGRLLTGVDQVSPATSVKSCTLLAPAATVDFYREHLLPRLGNPSDRIGLGVIDLYNLNDQLELDDTVGPYRKSLLYLVSRAFERETPKKLLGMEIYSKNLNANGLKHYYSNGDTGSTTRSATHGGFDNDVYTMNSVLKRVLGKKAESPFTAEELDY